MIPENHLHPQAELAIPQLPALDVEACLEFLESRLGFARGFAYGHPVDYAGAKLDGVELHLFACEHQLVCEWSSARVVVKHLDALYAKAQANQAVHPKGAIADRSWGWREFTAMLPGGAIVVFCERLAD